MAVTTINVDDILPTKADGDIVTAADWNKLVALFVAINGNAVELLNTNKRVDINSANMLNITAGIVPEHSITCDKLATTSTTHETYIETEDTTPVTGTTYYTYANGVYTSADVSSGFTSGVTYYVIETTLSGPAISSADVIADAVITGNKLAAGTITNDKCSNNILNALFSAGTCITDKAVTGTLAANTSLSGEIALGVNYKAVTIVMPEEIIILNSVTTKPDLYIGNKLKYNSVTGSINYTYMHCKINTNKTTTVQTDVYYGSNGGSVTEHYGIASNSNIKVNYLYLTTDGKIKYSLSNLRDYACAYTLCSNIFVI